jgi:superfamily II DNA or RNA helicase
MPKGSGPALSVATPASIPRVGMLATVRNRRGVISAVEPFGSGAKEGLLHLVTLEWADAGSSTEETVVWEREPFARLLEAKALPDVEGEPAMRPDDFDALVRSARWTAMRPFLDPDGGDGPLSRLPIASPFHGALQPEDYQLVPLLKALRMPRIALLVADDVGLGKTIEAGLILTELILRRRARRILILCPASLRSQWLGELLDRFSLRFEEVDRRSTELLRRDLGPDANPFRVHQKVVASYDYVKQPDVLAELTSAVAPSASSLPWDLLVVDEAHNLAPGPVGEESELSRMLGGLVPLFEHRLFLTATPHNGFTRSFSGLLERLDPVRFTRRDELTAAEEARVEDVLVRRLKREINARTNPPRFSERLLAPVPLHLSSEERVLSAAFQAFRAALRAAVAPASRAEQRAGSFAAEVLGKRLLSGPVPFADSWWRTVEGLADPVAADAAEVRAAERAASEETPNDAEADARLAQAARTVGAWLSPLRGTLAAEIDAVGRALGALGLPPDGTPPAARRPSRDARFDALKRLVEERLVVDGTFRSDDRLVVFTEYRTTLDSLAARLTEAFPAPGALRTLTGGMDPKERDAIKAAFNDPDDRVRILVATDAASEGLNLQETARFLLHYDVPWNPARLEQRNGRLDRYGQARDVTVFHFASDEDEDLAFLAYVIAKVESIREDLGATGEVFEAAFEARFLEGRATGEVRAGVEKGVAAARGRASFRRDSRARSAAGADAAGSEEEGRALAALAREVDLDPESLATTLESALAIGASRPRLDLPDPRGRRRLTPPVPATWAGLVDEVLRRPGAFGGRGALPALVFDPKAFLDTRNGRPVFRPASDAVLLHLGHPLLQRVFSTWARARFPGSGLAASRWTVRRVAAGSLPEGAEALVLLTVEELAVNELREAIHHWVRTLAWPVSKGRLGALLPHRPARDWRAGSGIPSRADVDSARDLLGPLLGNLKESARAQVESLGRDLSAEVARRGTEELEDERKRFLSRQGELSTLIEQQSVARVEREIARLREEARQGLLFDAAGRLEELERSAAAREEELRRRTLHYHELRDQLGRERDRVLREIVPRRFALRGGVQLFPVALEVRLPAATDPNMAEME